MEKNVLRSILPVHEFFNDFLYPVFRRDVLWYGDVPPSVRLSICPSVTVFRSFLLHALTYWAEILHVTFFLWAFNQVRVSSISIKFCRSFYGGIFRTLNFFCNISYLWRSTYLLKRSTLVSRRLIILNPWLITGCNQVCKFYVQPC